ncbi:MAG: activase [Desulfobacteraceae bacterium 4572_88]|nr:MAG: activase [Desulfobacteraceae bacterium 4572_88]
MKSEFKKKNIPEGLSAVGLCLGASTISVVHVRAEQSGSGTEVQPKIIDSATYFHEGNIRQTLISVVGKLAPASFDRIAATGRRFRKFVNLSSIPEPEAVEYAYRFVKPPEVSCPAVVSAGGETFMVYVLNRLGQISNVLTGNKCASGTGEFFLQQLRRMDVSLEEAAEWAVTEAPYRVSGRCSVFCKSDCTHATNKGIPKSKVTAGLCKMMADKILELLKKVERRNIMITGGTTQNQTMLDYLRREIPGLIVPDESPYFEALGTALWALEHETAPFPGSSPDAPSTLFSSEATSFDTLSALRGFENMVEFKSIEQGEIQAGEICILGLDVGSTTTKAVLIRKSDNALLASVYLRTNGEPVGASRQCYRSLLDQVSSELGTRNPELRIAGLGVCGSGRQIAGLHALTDGVINEIIAHATAAVHFDSRVDTIFEIGGQDAKYTYITNSVPSDYAMNEACSAGTGSFLEESAKETLGVEMEDIAEIAMRGKYPPNFNDQCAAFITSDIKNAIHEGVGHEDIVAGLVYSICMNYANRVKGNRPMGTKVFMQGGVCYNRAVPLAMASLVGKPIIVPPEPGLMGAYGVALEVGKRLGSGLMAEQQFDLETLISREVRYGKTFICRGGKEKCDRRCEVSMIEIEGGKYPFGGACNRYYNMRYDIKYDVRQLDLIWLRQELIFEKYGVKPEAGKQKLGTRKRVGMNRSFLVNSYYPLYSNFFAELGFDIVLPDVSSEEGIDRKNAAFCYPAELAHGFFYALLENENPPESIFLPHFKSVEVPKGYSSSQVCPFVQGETFYLRTTFREELDALGEKGTKVLTPLLDMVKGLETAKAPLVETALEMGADRQTAERAFAKALERQRACMAEMREIGKQAIRKLETEPEKNAVVIFARPYNGFVGEAHMGIPHKLASRGVLVIPFDFLSLDDEKAKRHMYWGMGQLITRAARVVERHPQLFGTYITNFSCGPDSFLLGYFRDIMGRKPSLTLELDSHTADAGLETRIEAFLDIVTAYRQLLTQNQIEQRKQTFVPARTVLGNGTAKVITSSGKELPLNDPRVTLLIPSMGILSSNALAAAFRAEGLRARANPPANEAVLKLGRANTSCKECLPLILTTGSLLSYVGNGRSGDEILIYFMATASGPCRFGQYYVFMEDLIRKLEIPDVALFSLTSENSYSGLGSSFYKKAWWAFVISDVMEDIRSMLLTNAEDTKSAMEIFEREWDQIVFDLEYCDIPGAEEQLCRTAERLGGIPMKCSPETVPMVSLVGEIFVRRDGLSRQHITETLARKGFATVCSPIAEWMHYSDYLVDKNLVDYSMSNMEKFRFHLKKKYMARAEKRIKSILSCSGLVHAEPLRIESIIEKGARYVSPNLPGEAILTVGSSLAEVVSHTCGVIAIGPFGCMPNRMSEAILNEAMSREGKLASEPDNERLKTILGSIEDLPFLAIESDGSPFPQVINAKLETFCLRAERLHQQMLEAKNN